MTCKNFQGIIGDKEFIRNYYERFKALYDFIFSRLDDDGYVCKREGDWIFIDWCDDMDKSSPLCAEQILLWKTKTVMASLSEICEKTARIKASADVGTLVAGGKEYEIPKGKEIKIKVNIN